MFAAYPEDLKTSQKGAILVGVPLFTGCLFLAIMCAMLVSAQSQAEKELHTKNIIMHKQVIDGLIMDSAAAAYHSAILTNDSKVKALDSLSKDLDNEFSILKGLVKNDKKLYQQVLEAEATSKAGVDWAREVESGKLLGAGEYEPMGILQMVQKVRKFYAAAIMNEKRIEKALVEQQKDPGISSEQWTTIIAFVLFLGVVINLGMSVAGAMFFGRSMTRRLNVMVDNSIRLAVDQPLNAKLSGHDEIAQLDAVFHNMASELKTARRIEKAIVDHSIDVICSIDLNDRFTAVNNAAKSVWQYASEELLGRHLIDIVAKDDVEKTRENLHACQQTLEERTFQNRIKRKDGQLVDMLWSVNWSKARKSYFCVAHDITQRLKEEELLQAAESRLRLILQSMPVGIVIGSESGNIDTTNAKMQSMFGYSDDEMAGQPLSKLFAGTAPDEDFLARLGETASNHPLEFEARRKDASKFPAQLAFNYFFLHGEIKPLIVIADISQRKEVERLKHEIVAMISHDLKAPLTMLRLTLQMLQKGSLGELSARGIERVNNMEREIERLITLISNLLDIEKLDAGAVEIRKEVITFAPIVEQSLMSVGYLAEKNGVQIQTDITDAEAFADAGGLVQVLVNLLANAIKFSPSGSTITVAVKEVEGGVKVSVKDQGRGIPESHRAEIFDRFKQVERSDRTEKKGSGLGLAICKSIIEGHGGTIGVDSELAAGSTFWFLIPVED